MSSEQTRYPLSWPDRWRRTAFRERSRFRGNTGHHSLETAVLFLQRELDALGASRCILSTNVPLRLDGIPGSNLAQPRDPGAAVYFQFKSRPMSLACDRWDRVECNVWAIAKHIEALRGQERWGVGSLEQAFRGYQALPERSEIADWWTTLGVPVNASRDQVRAAYANLAKRHHPDAGGEQENFLRVQRAWETFEAQHPE